MTINELEDKHWDTWCILDDETDHAKLTVQFTVEILEEVSKLCFADRNIIDDKIQELKQYLDE